MMADSSIPKSAADELSRRDELDERLRWLITLRWVALAGVGVAVIAARALELIGSMWPLAIIGGGMVIMNVGFHGLHARFPVRTLRALSAEALLQIAVDVLGLGALIFFSGGLDNPFIFFFCFHVVIAAILLEKREAYGVALLSALVVLALGVADQFGWNSAWSLRGVLGGTSRSHLLRYGLVFALGTTLLIAVYMVTAIIDRLRASTGDVRRLNAILNERVEMLASAERKLAAEHQRARAILECMDEGVVVVDLQGKVLLANSAAQQSALLALDETLNKAGTTKNADCNLRDSGCLDDHFDHQTVSLVELARSDSNPKSAIANSKSEECPAESPAQCLQEVLANGGHLCAATLALLGASPPSSEGPPRLSPPKSPTLAEIELRGRRFENTVSAVRTGNETVGIVVVSRDVTDRRLLERQVVHSEKLHALGNLAAGVAHELNTPLGTILGYAQMLLEDVSEPHANGNGRTEAAGQRQELKSIEDQARRCRKIVQGLLDFARKSGGGREDCSPNELVVKIRDLIAHSLELRGIDIKLDLCDPQPPSIRVASNEIEQVLVNLITNAADAIEMAAPQAQPERNPTIRIETRREPGGGVLIAVEDNGPGVPPELSEQIFEPFFTTKVAGRGTGLGLSIARRIVEDHEGRLLLSRRSNGQTGARFEIHLNSTVAPPVPVRV